MEVRLGRTWRSMVPSLAAQLDDALEGPFARGMVLVDTAGSARLLSQAVAQELGISAGVDFLTLAQFRQQLATQSGVTDDWRTWHSTRLVTAIVEALPDVAPEYPALAVHLAQPGRPLAAASRFATLLRSVVEHRPEVAAAWLDGDDAIPIPGHLAWQPALLRAACERLMLDPLELHDALLAAAEESQGPLWVFGLDELSPVGVALVRAAAPRVAWFVAEAPEWVRSIADDVPQPLEMPRVVVEVHGSHSRSRQAEVLRDELVRHFEADETLEPRDVRVVCPRPQEWAPVLNAVFRAGSAHPGGRLRVAEVSPSGVGNVALEALLATIDLADARATATEVVEYLLHPALASRWGFADRREDLVQLVHDARIHWGLDAGHRARVGLDGATAGTWVAGIDALLTGVCMGESAGPRGVVGVPTTTPADLDLIGALAEVIGRVWTFASQSASPLTVDHWCSLSAALVDDLLDLPPEDRWMIRRVELVLARLARSHAGATLTLGRREFRRLLAAELPSGQHRPAVGNGALHVVAPHELPHVDARLVACIGLEDVSAGGLPDEIPGLLPDPRRRLRRQLLAHARAAERLVVVTRTRSETTGARLDMPVVIRSLVRGLGQPLPDVVEHSPQRFNPSAFFDDGSFDAAAHAGALASFVRSDAPKPLRRREALELPVGEAPARIALDDLRAFLADPVKPFLRHTLGVRTVAQPELSDGLPLAVKGLDWWALTDAFIRGGLEHMSWDDLERRAQRAQQLPPGRLGQDVARSARERVEDIVRRASALMEPSPRRVPLEVDVDGILLSGSATLHGDRIVVASASSGLKSQLGPWLELLMLALVGERAQAVVLRPGSRGARSTTLRQPPVEVAREALGWFVRAFAIGQHRLLPVPFEPAFRLVAEQSRGTFRKREWIQPRPGAWPKWRHVDELWRLFYDDAQAELFNDAPTALDPAGAASGFEAWAPTLYATMISQGATW